MKQFTILIFLILLNSNKDSNAQEWSSIPKSITSNGLLFIGKIVCVNEYYYDITNGIENITMERTMAFNRKGLLIKQSVRHFEDNGKQTDSSINYYFINRKLASYTSFKADKLTDSVSLLYDRKNKLKQKVMYSRVGKISQRITYTYLHDSVFTIRKKDKDNNIESMLRITYGPKKTDKEIILLNSQLQTVSKSVINMENRSDGNRYITHYLYNVNDSCISMNGSLIDSKGYVLESMLMNGEKKVDNYHTYKYENGLLTKEYTYANETEQNIAYAYNYDTLKNITDIFTYIDRKLTKEMHRDIIYFQTN